MMWSSCGPTCSPPWPPRYRCWDLLLALAGSAAFLVDLGADVWMAASYVQAGDYHWGGLVLGLLVLSSLTTQLFSWAWYQSDPQELREELPSERTLRALHFLQLGYLYRCFRVLKAGWRVCRMETATDAARSHAVFLSHDISLLRLFETFLESAPQLTLLLYIVFHTSKVEIFQMLGIGTSFLCIAWALLDYHQSLRSFLRDKHKLGFLSSAVYFLWNFLLVCPRLLCLALFAVTFSRCLLLHFLSLWLVMFLWVSLQDTNFMENPGYEWLYRAVVAVILYFSWFNVAEGRTLCRSAIYYTFLMLDSAILGASWLWIEAPWDLDSHLLWALLASLPCYLLGLLLRGVYYQSFHPSRRVESPVTYDEVDSREPLGRAAPMALQQPLVGPVNVRMFKLSQHFSTDPSPDLRSQGNGVAYT